MTAADFRRLALSMPEAVEGSHFGVADFRVGKKIFATLAFEKEGYGVLLLTPDQQAGMVEDEPEIFSPVPGGWGKMDPRESDSPRLLPTSWKAHCEPHGSERRLSAWWTRNQKSSRRSSVVSRLVSKNRARSAPLATDA